MGHTDLYTMVTGAEPEVAVHCRKEASLRLGIPFRVDYSTTVHGPRIVPTAPMTTVPATATAWKIKLQYEATKASRMEHKKKMMEFADQTQAEKVTDPASMDNTAVSDVDREIQMLNASARQEKMERKKGAGTVAALTCLNTKIDTSDHMKTKAVHPKTDQKSTNTLKKQRQQERRMAKKHLLEQQRAQQAQRDFLKETAAGFVERPVTEYTPDADVHSTASGSSRNYNRRQAKIADTSNDDTAVSLQIALWEAKMYRRPLEPEVPAGFMT